MIPALLAQLAPTLEGIAVQAATQAATGAASDIIGKLSNRGGGNMIPGPLAMAIPGGASFTIASGAAHRIVTSPLDVAGGTAGFAGNTLGAFAGAAGNQVEGRVLGEVGDRASLLAEKLGDAATSIDPRNWIDLALVVVDSITQLEKWGDALTSSADQLKAFNVDMAQASAEKRLGAIQRGMSLASMTGESTLDLTESLEGLKNELLPMRADITNITNNLMVELIDIGTDLARTVTAWYKWAKTGLVNLVGLIGLIGASIVSIFSRQKGMDVLTETAKVLAAISGPASSSPKMPQGDFLRAAIRKNELFNPLGMAAPPP